MPRKVSSKDLRRYMQQHQMTPITEEATEMPPAPPPSLASSGSLRSQRERLSTQSVPPPPKNLRKLRMSSDQIRREAMQRAVKEHLHEVAMREQEAILEQARQALDEAFERLGALMLNINLEADEDDAEMLRTITRSNAIRRPARQVVGQTHEQNTPAQRNQPEDGGVVRGSIRPGGEEERPTSGPQRPARPLSAWWEDTGDKEQS